jgi:hypothetical protein
VVRFTVALVSLLSLLAGQSRADCPGPLNLLAGRPPSAWRDIRGVLARATDGEVAPEGAIWDAPLAVQLDTDRAALTWDLGQVVPLEAAWIQADANDSYTVRGSLDGRTFRDLGRIEPVTGHGLRSRKLALGGAPARFLRFGEGVGDGFYSLSEIQVFCQLPVPFPPPARVGTAPPATVRRTIYSYWNDASSARWELVLALLGLGLLGWGRHLRRAGRAEHLRRLRDGLLATLGVLAALSYVNFGFFHFGRFLHEHEWTHYYLGGKYFPELSYERLYHCLSTADAEDGLGRRVALRKVTNLTTNDLEKTDQILAHPEVCKAHFSDERWASFRRDVRFFRNRQAPLDWDHVEVDHGFNAPPTWTLLGGTLANLAPASATQIWLLALLDPLYLLATVGVVWWAFGWRVLSVALLVLATSFPSRFYWTGGSYLRWDWLFYLVAALSCLRKERPLLAGTALGYATLLRIFPLFLFVGPALALGWQLRAKRRWDGPHLRFLAAGATTCALLFGLSLALAGGPRAWGAFLRNTRKHQQTAMTNNVGLRTVVAWRPAEVGRLLQDERLADPWAPWKMARLAAFHQALPLYLPMVAGFLVLLALAVRDRPPWIAAALAVALIPVSVELLSYYAAFIVGLALLHQADEEVGLWLLALTAFTQFLAWAPLPWMSRWLDEQYTGMSAAMIAVFVAVVALFARPAGLTSAAGAAPSTPTR